MSIFKDINVCYVYVRDWQAARSFYDQLLGWPEAFSSEEMGWTEWGLPGQAHFAINRWDREGELPPAGPPILVLSVEDAFQAAEELRSKGICCDDVRDIPGVGAYGAFLFSFASQSLVTNP